MGSACIIFDTDILIAVGKLDRFDLLAAWPDVAFKTTEVNMRELLRPESRAPVQQALDDGILDLAPLETIEEIALFALFRIQTGLGEAAALATACHHADSAATHDKKAKKVAATHKPPVKVVQLDHILVRCYQMGRLVHEELSRIEEALRISGDLGIFATGIPGAVEAMDIAAPWD